METKFLGGQLTGLRTIIETLKKTRNDPLLSVVDKMLLLRNEVATEVEGWLHPSALVPWRKGWEHICPRELFFTRFADIGKWPKELLQDDFSPRTFRIFDNGQWVHRRWQIYLIQAGMVDPRKGVGWEVPVHDPKIGILGHLDALVYPESAGVNRVSIRYYDHGIPQFSADGGLIHKIESNDGQWIAKGKPVIVDVKSTKEEYWKALHAKPMLEHQVQMSCYMAVLKIPVAHLLYENKNTQEVKEIVYSLERGPWHKFRKILLDVDRARKERRLPERICRSALGQRARECPWVDPCFRTQKFSQLIQIEHGHTKKTTWQGGRR
jgi:hypothetical protein